MHSRAAHSKGERSLDKRRPGRLRAGSILPLVALMVTVVVAFLTLTADVMRTVYAAERLQSGVEAAALGALSVSVNPDGEYSSASAENNILAALNIAGGGGGQAWNQAPAGPTSQSGNPETDISFAPEDVTFEFNPADGTDLILRLKARRDGSNAISNFFMPAIFAFNGGNIPQEAYESKPYRIAEVIAQPAARVGAAPQSGAGSGSARAADLAGFAVFPMALSNAQFAAAAAPSGATTSYTIDMVSGGQSVSAGHIKGAFVNLAATGSSLEYYGAAQGNNAIGDLKGLLAYFSGAASTGVTPAAVERGSMLAAFDPNEVNFKQREAEIKTALQQVPLNRNYILPVLADDPNPALGGRHAVVGFAYARLTGIINQSTGAIQPVISLSQSAPTRNATVGDGWCALPPSGRVRMGAPVPPFQARVLQADGVSITPLPRGVVMAPSLSPRKTVTITATAPAT